MASLALPISTEGGRWERSLNISMHTSAGFVVLLMEKHDKI